MIQSANPSIQSLAFFMPSFAGGGAERATIQLASALIARDLSVALVVPSSNGPLCRFAETSGAEIVDLGTKRVRYSVAALAHYLRQHRPDALVSSPNDTVFFAQVARSVAGTHEVKLVGVIHNSWQKFQPARLDPKRTAVSMAYKWALKRANRIVCVSEGVRQGLLVATGVDSTVIRDAIDIRSVVRRSHEPVSHRWLDGDHHVVLGVGRLTWQKDFQTLIEAFGILKAELPTSKLLLLGDGELREDLQAQIADHGLTDDAELLGFVDNPWAHMARSSVLAMSSRFEGLGLVLVEAMACGIPVVATDCPSGPAEVLDHGRLGKLVPVGDAESMASALHNALTSPRMSVDLGELVETYSPAVVAKQFIEAIDQSN